MGVAGSGKTTISQALANALGWLFIEGDDYHPQANADKIATGVPLDDNDRWPWLRALREAIKSILETGQSVVVSCSALKQSYRDYLQNEGSGCRFVYLKGSYDLIHRRMQARPHPYMRPELLPSQFETLEEPKDALVIDISKSIEEIVEIILSGLAISLTD
jgi:carbohydrate kinase (thermoresistant glucokinase family)